VKVAAATPDLMDRSRITSAVRAVPDVEVTFVASPDALVGLAGVTVALVDLSKRGALDALPAIVASGARVVAYGSHVDRSLLDAARAAGVHDVLPRSAFFARLPSLLRDERIE
jgi:DNA-binding NarL/FixJ family response regulator